jgi:hypothetical protein
MLDDSQLDGQLALYIHIRMNSMDPKTLKILKQIDGLELRSSCSRTDSSLERQRRQSRTPATPVYGEELCGLATAAVFQHLQWHPLGGEHSLSKNYEFGYRDRGRNTDVK